MTLTWLGTPFQLGALDPRVVLLPSLWWLFRVFKSETHPAGP